MAKRMISEKLGLVSVIILSYFCIIICGALMLTDSVVAPFNIQGMALIIEVISVNVGAKEN